MTASDSRRLEDQLVPIEPEVVPASATLFGSDDPEVVIEKATALATALKRVIVDQGLTSTISGQEYVRVEGWTLLGTLLGVFPVCLWTRPMEHGWEARVEARTLSGAIVGAAEAQCLRSETNWANREDFAVRSMAQTRATAKALRLPLGYVIKMAGYETTPAEEMTFSGSGVASPSRGDRPPAPEPNSDMEVEAPEGKELIPDVVDKITIQCEELGWGRPGSQEREEIARLVQVLGADGRNGVRSAFNFVAKQDAPDNPIKYAINILRKRERESS